MIHKLLTTLLILSFASLFFSCENNQSTNHESGGDEESLEHKLYDFKRLRNPRTNVIPKQIKNNSLTFASQLPKIDDTRRSFNWVSLGPDNFGGRTRAFALDVSNPQIILAGGVSGGMWRSENGGTHFNKTTAANQIHSVSCIAQDKRTGKQNIWYYGTGEYYGIVSISSFDNLFSGNGIYKSTDGGRTWAALPSTQSNTPTTYLGNNQFDFVWQIVCDHTNLTQDVILAAVYNGIYRSTDGGNSWTAVLGLDSTATAFSDYVDLLQTDDGVFYAALSQYSSYKGIWRSTDGINWTNITPTSFSTNYNRIEMAFAPSDNNQLYLIVQRNGSPEHHLWKYKYVGGDGSGSGGLWYNRTANLPDQDCLGFYTFNFGPYDSQSGYDMCIAVHPDDTNFVLLGGTNIYRSADGFSSNNYEWIGGYQCDATTPSNYVWPHHHPDQHVLWFDATNHNKLYSTNDGGVFVSNNISDATPVWLSLNNHYVTTQFYTCAIEPGNTSNPIVIGGLQDNGTWFVNSSLMQESWKQVLYGDGAFCAIAEGRDNYYLSWQGGKTFKFEIDDNGDVTGMERIDPLGGSAYQFINPFILDPSDNNRMYLCAGRYIWRNDSLSAIPITGNEYNPGTIGWSKLNGSSTGIGLTSPLISCLDMSRQNHDKLWFGTEKGQLYLLDSAQADKPKINKTASNFPANAYLAAIDVDDFNENEMILCFSNYEVPSIFYSEDGGTTFTDVSGNLEENPDGSGNGPSVNWVNVFDNGTEKVYFAGTSVGLFSTTDLNGAATVWQQEGSSSIGNTVINMITSRAYDGKVVVATHGNGVYAYTINPISHASDNVIQENDFTVWPNPMKNFLQIDIQNKVAKRIEFYDLNGKQIDSIAIQSTRLSWTKPKGFNGIVLLLIKDEQGNIMETQKVLSLY